MKYVIFLLIVIFGTVDLFAQSKWEADSLASVEIALSQMHGSNDTFVLSKQIKRNRNLEFVQQTLNYAPLSYASPPFLDIGSPKNGYILSADISPNFVVGGRWMPLPIHLTARYKVRIFRENAEEGDSSLPVRTPSFMPGATIFIPLQPYLNSYSTRLSYLGLSFFHHSNGQDGSEFHGDGRINLYNGNFSTNFIELAYHTRKRFGNYFTPYQTSAGYNDLHGRIGYEHHVGTAEPLRSSYGAHRINVNATWINVRKFEDIIKEVRVDDPYLRELFRVILNSTVIAGKRNQGLGSIEKRINFDLNLHWRIRSSPNTSLFLGGGYYGSDPYNIYYQQSYGFARMGVALGFFISSSADVK